MSLLTGFSQGSLGAVIASGSTPLHGSISIVGNIITYTPDSTYEGDDSFDITLNCDTESVNITVEDAPLIPITSIVIEQADPYADANLQLKVNSIAITTINGSDTVTDNIHFGDIITFEAFGERPSTGDNPVQRLVVVKNGVTIYDSTTPDNPPVTSLIAGPYTVAVGDVYTATASTTADIPSGVITCGTPATYSGGIGFPNNLFYNLGSALGLVDITYDAFSIPDKFIGYCGGVQVFDTGYRGDSSYQSALDAALIARGLPTETIAGVGAGTTSFSKIVTDNYVLVEVYSPLTGTAWNFQMDCPV